MQQNKLIQTLLQLAAFDEVYPNESKVLDYVKERLTVAKVTYKQDQIGNIVAYIPGQQPDSLAIVGHVDIAAPLNNRQTITTNDIIKTDGTGLLGGDDKTAVAAMLELADYFHETKTKPNQSLELIFTVGEEAGLVGAVNLDMSLVSAKQALIFDWIGGVERIITKSPAYYKLDVHYTGKNAHPAKWQDGKNAGQALMIAASQLKQGEFTDGVTFNIGQVNIGEARNQVPGNASLFAELRSYDEALNLKTAEQIKSHFEKIANEHNVSAEVKLDSETYSYQLDQTSQIFQKVESQLAKINKQPVLEPSYGCFDGNILAGRGIDTVIMGAAYYNPHGPDEYVDIKEFEEMYKFIKNFTT